MRRITTTMLAVTLVLALAASGWGQGLMYMPWETISPETESTPSWTGFTGLVLTPTALIAPAQEISSFFHQIRQADGNQEIYGATIGLLPSLEVGVARLSNVPQDTPDPSFASETVLNVKYTANIGGLFNNPAAPQMAIGIYDASDQVNRVNYVVLSHSLGLSAGSTSVLPNMTLHVGYGNAEHDGGALDGLFGGIDFVPSRGLLAQIEHDGQDINGVLRYFPADWISLDVGVVKSEYGYGLSVKTPF